MKADIFDEVPVAGDGVDQRGRERIGRLEGWRRGDAVFDGEKADVWAQVLEISFVQGSGDIFRMRRARLEAQDLVSYCLHAERDTYYMGATYIASSWSAYSAKAHIGIRLTMHVIYDALLG